MYQKLIVVGRLGRDPEMRYMPDGSAVTNFSIATGNKWTGADGEIHEETTWFRVSVWGKQAESANQYLAKGRQVLVEGRLQSDPATGGPKLFTRNDGSVGSAFELRAFQVKFLGGRDDAAQEQGGSVGAAVTEEDDIPF